MQTTNRTASAVKVRQPVGTSHFQFRDHQFLVGSGGIDGSGGVGSMKSFCPPAKSKSSNLHCLYALDFLGKSLRNGNEFRICRATRSSKKQ
jgi:hypothetical protein